MASRRVSRSLNDDEISQLLNDTASDLDSDTELVDRAEIEDFGGESDTTMSDNERPRPSKRARERTNFF